jgi:hypothetical protein
MSEDSPKTSPELESARRVAQALRADFRGQILARPEPGFTEAAAIWNAAAARNPGVILRCSNMRDVQMAIRCAVAEGPPTAVRCGGHSLAGFSSCQDGVVIDLGALRQVDVDVETRRARVGGGCLLGTIDRATAPAGLVFPAGVVSHTGASGLILGGGTGWLTRRFGLSCDNVESYSLVTCEGETVRASERENCSLFWALRGGGGNFGIVTEFALRLHPLRTVLLATGVSEQAGIVQAMGFWRDFMPEAPQDLKWNLSLVTTEGAGVALSHAAVWTGPARPGTRLLNWIFESVGVKPACREISYLDLQTIADAEFPHGDRYYSKSGYFRALDDESIATMVDAMERAPSSRNQVEIAYLGGAASCVNASETAFGDRSAPFILNLLGQWKQASEDAANTAWVRGLFASLRPRMQPGVYVNFMSGDENERTREVYGEHWQRLLAIKKEYDPRNFFRFNQNVSDSASARSEGTAARK